MTNVNHSSLEMPYSTLPFTTPRLGGERPPKQTRIYRSGSGPRGRMPRDLNAGYPKPRDVRGGETAKRTRQYAFV